MDDRPLRQYELERRLALRLMNAASAEERQKLYGEVYEELYRSFPHLQSEDGRARKRRVRSALAFLAPMLAPDTVFLEIGPGRCDLLRAVAPRVKLALAVDAAMLAEEQGLPDNVRHMVLVGSRFPVEDRTVDLAYSYQVIEHLHPHDVVTHLSEVRRVLKPGGRYALVTPSRLTGPHDISFAFTPVATAMHLKEYTNADLCRLLAEAGFARVVPFVGGRGRFRPAPAELVRAAEALFALLPRRLRRNALVRGIAGVRLVATA